MPSGIYVSGQGEAIYQHAKTLSNFCNELQMKAIFKHPIHQREKKLRPYSFQAYRHRIRGVEVSISELQASALGGAQWSAL